MTRIHAADGQLVAEHARERRLYLPIQAVPDLIKAAFLSAEDKNFYEHDGRRPAGHRPRASSSTCATAAPASARSAPRPSRSRSPRTSCSPNEVSYERKIKEALLALRIEQAYSKDKIFELYLNEIYLGLGSYGIAAAALNYFDKPVNQLTSPRPPISRRCRRRRRTTTRSAIEDRAIERRNWVIDRMVENGYIRAADGEAAKAEPLDGHDPPARQLPLRRRSSSPRRCAATSSSMFGSEKLYEGGLSVRTTLDPKLQVLARDGAA